MGPRPLLLTWTLLGCGTTVEAGAPTPLYPPLEATIEDGDGPYNAFGGFTLRESPSGPMVTFQGTGWSQSGARFDMLVYHLSLNEDASRRFARGERIEGFESPTSPGLFSLVAYPVFGPRGREGIQHEPGGRISRSVRWIQLSFRPHHTVVIDMQLGPVTQVEGSPRMLSRETVTMQLQGRPSVACLVYSGQTDQGVRTVVGDASFSTPFCQTHGDRHGLRALAQRLGQF